MDDKSLSGCELITIVDAAKSLGIGYTTMRRYYRKLIEDGIIEDIKHIKRSTGHQSQCVTASHLDHIRTHYMNPIWYSHKKDRSRPLLSVQDDGVFYLILLVPEFSPTRIKAGFTENMDTRLRSHMVAAPTASLIKTFPCKRIWEGYLLSLVEKHGQCIRTEVFDIKEIDPLLSDISKALRMVKKPDSASK